MISAKVDAPSVKRLKLSFSSRLTSLSAAKRFDDSVIKESREEATFSKVESGESVSSLMVLYPELSKSTPMLVSADNFSISESDWIKSPNIFFISSNDDFASFCFAAVKDMYFN